MEKQQDMKAISGQFQNERLAYPKPLMRNHGSFYSWYLFSNTKTYKGYCSKKWKGGWSPMMNSVEFKLYPIVTIKPLTDLLIRYLVSALFLN